jgi:hypothetical protein
MDEKMREFVLDHAGQAQTHEDWLTFVRFGRETLLKDPGFMARIIGDEVDREIERDQSGDGPAETWARILRSLNMELVDSAASLLSRLLGGKNPGPSFGRLGVVSSAAVSSESQMNADDHR